jgi:polysaccharide pyruvyl transferase WcaK-like protein
MRYHPLIICLKYFKPFVIISDENKLKNFAKTFNLKIFNLDKKNIDYLKINDYINTCKINYRKYWNMLNLKRFLNR